jgi:hypothetical protein
MRGAAISSLRRFAVVCALMADGLMVSWSVIAKSIYKEWGLKNKICSYRQYEL